MLSPRTFTSWLNSALPKNTGADFHDDLQCFGIPFGGLGFLSEITIYYTTICLLLNVNALPWSPFKPTTFAFFQPIERGWGNLLISVVAVLAVMPLGILTMIRCRTKWELVLVCIFRMGIGLAVAVLALYRSVTAEDQDELAKEDGVRTDVGLRSTDGDPEAEVELLATESRAKKGTPALDLACTIGIRMAWVFGPIAAALTIFGCLFDTIAVTSIVVKAFNSGEIQMTTGRKVGLWITTPLRVIAFYGWIAGIFGLAGEGGAYVFVGSIWMLLVYSDWSIADAAHQLDGVPSSSAAAVYWLYFLAKKLPMLLG
jgi:hypothetical protein